MQPSNSYLLQVRVNMADAPVGLEHLTPGKSLAWGRCRFAINPEGPGVADFAIILGNARAYDKFECAPENTLLMVAEPESKKTYPRRFYRQFHHLIDTHSESGHPRVRETAPGLCWQVGFNSFTNSDIYGYDRLSQLTRPEKQNKISVVCSDAAHTPGQRQRLDFLAVLKKALGSDLVHFGRGFEPIADKMEAILPYRYHLVLENCQTSHYWTEKLADAYLGWAFPLSVGCTNLEDYFPPGSYRALDVSHPDRAIALIRGLLSAPEPVGAIEALAEARNRVLNLYNPFAWAAKWIEELYEKDASRMIEIRSHKAYRTFPKGLMYRIRQAQNWRRAAAAVRGRLRAESEPIAPLDPGPDGIV